MRLVMLNDSLLLVGWRRVKIINTADERSSYFVIFKAADPDKEIQIQTLLVMVFGRKTLDGTSLLK